MSDGKLSVASDLVVGGMDVTSFMASMAAQLRALQAQVEVLKMNISTQAQTLEVQDKEAMDAERRVNQTVQVKQALRGLA